MIEAEHLRSWTSEQWAEVLKDMTPDELQQLVILAWVSARADMYGELVAGFSRMERPAVIFARMAQQDSKLSASVGLSPLWGGGTTPEEAAKMPAPTVEDARAILRKAYGSES